MILLFTDPLCHLLVVCADRLRGLGCLVASSRQLLTLTIMAAQASVFSPDAAARDDEDIFCPGDVMLHMTSVAESASAADATATASSSGSSSGGGSWASPDACFRVVNPLLLLADAVDRTSTLVGGAVQSMCDRQLAALGSTSSTGGAGSGGSAAAAAAAPIIASSAGEEDDVGASGEGDGEGEDAAAGGSGSGTPGSDAAQLMRSVLRLVAALEDPFSRVNAARAVLHSGSSMVSMLLPAAEADPHAPCAPGSAGDALRRLRARALQLLRVCRRGVEVACGSVACDLAAFYGSDVAGSALAALGSGPDVPQVTALLVGQLLKDAAGSYELPDSVAPAGATVTSTTGSASGDAASAPSSGVVPPAYVPVTAATVAARRQLGMLQDRLPALSCALRDYRLFCFGALAEVLALENVVAEATAATAAGGRPAEGARASHDVASFVADSLRRDVDAEGYAGLAPAPGLCAVEAAVFAGQALNQLSAMPLTAALMPLARHALPRVSEQAEAAVGAVSGAPAPRGANRPLDDSLGRAAFHARRAEAAVSALLAVAHPSASRSCTRMPLPIARAAADALLMSVNLRELLAAAQPLHDTVALAKAAGVFPKTAAELAAEAKAAAPKANRRRQTDAGAALAAASGSSSSKDVPPERRLGAAAQLKMQLRSLLGPHLRCAGSIAASETAALLLGALPVNGSVSGAASASPSVMGAASGASGGGLCVGPDIASCSVAFCDPGEEALDIYPLEELLRACERWVSEAERSLRAAATSAAATAGGPSLATAEAKPE